jgi:nucleotide-binding universal stress UspA family protein
MKHHIDDISFNLIQPDFEEAMATMDHDSETVAPVQNQVTADELLRVAQSKNARALVMTNYAAKGFLQEMMFGTLALLASRKTPLPLLLIPPGHSFEGV